LARQDIPRKERDLVLLASGGRCAFPGCNRPLIVDCTANDGATTIGEIAHIVASSDIGPRASKKMPGAERNKSTNLILLCEPHHKTIDAQFTTYSISVLRQMKADHEERIRNVTSSAPVIPPPMMQTDTVHSTMLPVTHLPQVVFSASCSFTDGQDAEVKDRIRYPENPNELVPFLLRDGRLYAFQDLKEDEGPFADVIDRRTTTTHRSITLFKNAEGSRRYVTLLNRAMYKLSSRLGFRYEPDHKRFYFPVEEPGEERTVEYRPLNKKSSKRNVAWEPKKKKTGEGRGFWYHLAAGLRFHQMAHPHWCLTIRPERHLTKDGEIPLESGKIGRRVTRIKAKMYNKPYLDEVNFWRDILCQGKPRFILDFGAQTAVIDSELLAFSVKWAGIPGDKVAYKNSQYSDDLFSVSDLRIATGGGDSDWDEEEEDADDEDLDIE
jgi:hypothetical protein